MTIVSVLKQKLQSLFKQLADLFENLLVYLLLISILLWIFTTLLLFTKQKGVWSFYIPLNGFIAFIIVMTYFIEKKRNKDNFAIIEEEELSSVEYLKKNGLRIKVKLSDCRISSNSWQEETLIKHTSSFLEKPEVKHENISSSSVSHLHVFKDGTTKLFTSYMIDKSHAELSFIFKYVHQDTYIYVNKQNPNDYFFDLDFMYEK